METKWQEIAFWQTGASRGYRFLTPARVLLFGETELRQKNLPRLLRFILKNKTAGSDEGNTET